MGDQREGNARDIAAKILASRKPPEVAQTMSDLNDPRVFFAAERTLLAWNRTSLALMAFGFVIERFGLFLRLLAPERPEHPGWALSLWLGIAFLLLGAWSSAAAVLQYRRVLGSLKPVEIPAGYNTLNGVLMSALVALLGTSLCAYLVVTT